MAGMGAHRELCPGELLTFPAESLRMSWLQQAGVLRSGSRVLSPHNCQHPQSLYPLGEKNQGWKGEGRPGNKGWGAVFSFCFFSSLVESIESDNKLNYFSPSQLCSAHDGNSEPPFRCLKQWAFPVCPLPFWGRMMEQLGGYPRSIHHSHSPCLATWSSL